MTKAIEKNAPNTPNKMGVMPEWKLLLNMALPLIASMLVQALYNIVDSIYVSRISESAVTALSLVFPIQNLQIGFATGIAVGVNALFSRSLGEQNAEKANRYAGNGIFLCGISTALFMLFSIFGARPFIQMQSNTAETIENGTTYITICSVLVLGIFVEILCERLLQSTGRTVYTMFTQGTGAVLNILLDPVFIFGFEPLHIPAMGIAGAATATVIGQWVAALLAIFFNLKCNHELKLKLSYLRPRKEQLVPILSIGIPSVIMMAIGSVMTLGMNQILQSFHETATGVFGIYFKLQSFFFMPVFGLNNASISILAYNYGCRKPKRISRTLKWSAAIAFGIMVTGLLVFQFLPDLLLSMFEPSDEFLRIGRQALRTISWNFPLAAIGIALGASFQSLGKGIYATIISLCRQLLVLLPAAYLLSLTREVTNVWWAFPISECISMVITLLLFRRIYRKRIRPLQHAEEA